MNNNSKTVALQRPEMDQPLPSSTAAKRLWHIVRVVCYMIRKGFGKHKLMMELNLLLKRGKIAGKALGHLMTFHHHHHHHYHHGGGGGHRRHQHHHSSSDIYSSFSCRSMDPNVAYYNPKEVEFSCSNTPSFPSFHAIKHKSHHRSRGRRHDDDKEEGEFDAAMIAQALEILNTETWDADPASSLSSPSATPLWSIYLNSPEVMAAAPAPARQLRITDSPCLVTAEEEEDAAGGHIVDVKAEEFIKRFYEQLQLQQRITETTPPANWNRRREPIIGRA